MVEQTYEDYWRLTNAFTDYNNVGFLTTLKECVIFIDEFKSEIYSEDKYWRLQDRIKKSLRINEISTRKAINQLVKLGFISPFLKSYSEDSIDYLNAKTNRRRQSIFSKIVYSRSSFNSSVKKDSNLHQLNFLINTLVHNGKLSVEEIIALMLVNIEDIEKGFLNKEELHGYVLQAESNHFIKRKYNQVGYLINLLKKLDDIIIINNELYFTDDAKQIFGELNEKKLHQRNPYLHLLYKNQLKEESSFVYGVEKCMVERLSYPTLIASHIKPFIRSSEDEAYDPNNGLLLSQNLDGLFDKGLISFDDNGSIIISNTINAELKKYLQKYKLDDNFLNRDRKKYLIYHREFFKYKLNL